MKEGKEFKTDGLKQPTKLCLDNTYEGIYNFKKRVGHFKKRVGPIWPVDYHVILTIIDLNQVR